MIDFLVRRRLEMRAWFVAGADFPTIALAYDVKTASVKEAIFGRESKRSVSASIQATPEQINQPPITIAEALSEQPIVVSKGERVTSEKSFDRAFQIYRWRRAGISMAQIGKRLGIGSERAAQIMFSHGFPRIFRYGWRSETNGSGKEDGSVKA